MKSPNKLKSRRRRQSFRRFSLLLVSLGINSEVIAIFGMLIGILAGISFMATGEVANPRIFWISGMLLCLLRIGCIRIVRFMQSQSFRPSLEDTFFNELPERVSDAVTLIGFGFALDANPWLGLAAALSAIFSAYIRSIAFSRGANESTATSGPMTRLHRLHLLAVTSLLIILGCAVTVILRWLTIKAIKL